MHFLYKVSSCASLSQEATGTNTATKHGCRAGVVGPARGWRGRAWGHRAEQQDRLQLSRGQCRCTAGSMRTASGAPHTLAHTQYTHVHTHVHTPLTDTLRCGQCLQQQDHVSTEWPSSQNYHVLLGRMGAGPTGGGSENLICCRESSIRMPKTENGEATPIKQASPNSARPWGTRLPDTTRSHRSTPGC